MDYVRDPEAIYAQSFAEIDQLPELAGVPDALRPLTIRLIHACGMPDIIADLRYSADIADAARHALAGGADIYCDVETLRHGIMDRLLPEDCRQHCRISAPDTAAYAKQHGMTRAAAQFDLWGQRLTGQVVAIGNAPTALFRLLELLDEGRIGKPAAVIAFPVGFVGAAESKAELAAHPRQMPFVTLLGRRGGAGYAQAAVNALAGGLKR